MAFVPVMTPRINIIVPPPSELPENCLVCSIASLVPLSEGLTRDFRMVLVGAMMGMVLNTEEVEEFVLPLVCEDGTEIDLVFKVAEYMMTNR